MVSKSEAAASITKSVKKIARRVQRLAHTEVELSPATLAQILADIELDPETEANTKFNRGDALSAKDRMRELARKEELRTMPLEDECANYEGVRVQCEEVVSEAGRSTSSMQIGKKTSAVRFKDTNDVEKYSVDSD